MRKLIILFSILLAVIGLTACSLGGKQKAMGRYVEEFQALPEEIGQNKECITQMMIDPEGKLIIYTCDTALHRYTLQENGTWMKDAPDWGIGNTVTDGAIFRYSKNGKLYGAVFDQIKPETGSKIYELKEDGTKLELPMEGWDKADETGKLPMITDFAVTDNGDILTKMYQSDRGVIHDSGGKIISEFENGLYCPFLSVGSDIISVNDARDKVIIIDQQTGFNKKEIPITPSDPKSMYANIALYNEDEDNIYLADRDGIFYIDKNGSLLQTLVDGKSTSLNLSYLNIGILTKKADDSFYVLLLDESGITWQLKHYVYHPELPTVAEDELIIYSFEENEIIKEGIVDFQALHPEVHIDYRIAKVDGSNLPTEGYIKILNSEILAGDGADIIVCDGLPETEYIEKGLFEDISTVVNPLAQSDQLYGNIIDFYRQDDKIYTLPMKLGIYTYTGDENALAAVRISLEELARCSRNSPEPALLSNKMHYRLIFNWFYGIYYGELLDSDGSPVPEKLTAFLNQLKAINNYNEKYTDFEDLDIECYLDKLQKKCQLVPANICNMTDLLLALEAAAGTGNNICSSGVFEPETVVGINKHSKVKSIAEDFLRTLLSQEVQQRDRGLGIPLNKAAIAAWYERDTALRGLLSIIDEETGYTQQVELPADKYKVEKLVKMIGSVTAPVRYDTTVYNIIINEIDPFFQGERTAEEVTAVIMEKIATYNME